jgi:hypothetical protein
VERNSLLGSVYPRYFGYYDRALQLYTHTSGVVQNSPFLGYTGERKPPAFEARFRLRSWPVREAVSLPDQARCG